MISKLGLGTAQFGMDYGATNVGGRTAPAEAAKMLRTAHEAGIRWIDTAPAYGVSEDVLGRSWPAAHAFRIVTKTPVFKQARITQSDAQRLTDTFHLSLKTLRQTSLYALLAHHADDLLVDGGDVLIEAMQALKQRGLVQKIGVSVYSAAQIDGLLDRFAVDVIQVPMSVIDQRLLGSGHLGKLAARGIEVHVRSAFLQGIVLADTKALDEHFWPVRGLIEGYQDYCARQGLSPLEGALAFCTGRAEVACAIVGVCSMKELRELLAAAGTAIPPGLDFAPFACADERMVNPALWALPAERGRK
jgi:aryl-alcohol dehydrogenase-like predicted oxidoreductase